MRRRATPCDVEPGRASQPVGPHLFLDGALHDGFDARVQRVLGTELPRQLGGVLPGADPHPRNEARRELDRGRRRRGLEPAEELVERRDALAQRALEGNSSVNQMIMGQGKTTVIAPLLALILADGRRLVSQVCPAPLLEIAATSVSRPRGDPPPFHSLPPRFPTR